jgi:hypothetical protein
MGKGKITFFAVKRETRNVNERITSLRRLRPSVIHAEMIKTGLRAV